MKKILHQTNFQNSCKEKRFIYKWDMPDESEVPDKPPGKDEGPKPDLDKNNSPENLKLQDQFKADYKDKISADNKVVMEQKQGNVNYRYTFEMKPDGKVNVQKINLSEQQQEGKTNPISAEVTYSRLYAGPIPGMPELPQVLEANKPPKPAEQPPQPGKPGEQPPQNPAGPEKIDKPLNKADAEKQMTDKVNEILSRYENMDPATFVTYFRSWDQVLASASNEISAFNQDLARKIDPSVQASVTIKGFNLNSNGPTLNIGKFNNMTDVRSTDWAIKVFADRNEAMRDPNGYKECQNEMKQLSDYFNGPGLTSIYEKIQNGVIKNLDNLKQGINNMLTTGILDYRSPSPKSRETVMYITLKGVPLKLTFLTNTKIACSYEGQDFNLAHAFLDGTEERNSILGQSLRFDDKNTGYQPKRPIDNAALPPELAPLGKVNTEYQPVLDRINKFGDSPEGINIKVPANGKDVPVFYRKNGPDYYSIQFNGRTLNYRTQQEAMGAINNGDIARQVTWDTIVRPESYKGYEKMIDEFKEEPTIVNGRVYFQLDWKGRGKGEGNAEVYLDVQPNGFIKYSIHRDNVAIDGSSNREGYATNFDELMRQISNIKQWAESYGDNRENKKLTQGVINLENVSAQITDPRPYYMFENKIGHPVNFISNESTPKQRYKGMTVTLDWAAKDIPAQYAQLVVFPNTNGDGTIAASLALYQNGIQVNTTPIMAADLPTLFEAVAVLKAKNVPVAAPPAAPVKPPVAPPAAPANPPVVPPAAPANPPAKPGDKPADKPADKPVEKPAETKPTIDKLSTDQIMAQMKTQGFDKITVDTSSELNTFNYEYKGLKGTMVIKNEGYINFQIEGDKNPVWAVESKPSFNRDKFLAGDMNKVFTTMKSKFDEYNKKNKKA